MTTWDAANFEQEPQGSESVALGDDRIRELKREIRYRDEVEHDYGTNHGPSDNGRHRLGSARVFLESAAPTALDFSDYDAALGGSGSGVATLDDGRLWIDSTTFQLFVRDETNVSGLGASTWYPVFAPPTQIQSQVARTTDLDITSGAPTTVTWDGGVSDPSVTIPATGTWQIEVVLIGMTSSFGAPGSTHATVWITESVDGGAATLIPESKHVTRYGDTGYFRPLQRTVFRSTVNGSTYEYGVLGQRGAALAVRFNGTDPRAAAAPHQLETHLIVTARYSGA